MMKKFKDLDNKAHEIEEGFEHLLPGGSVEINQAEFDVLTAPPAPTAQEIEDAKNARIESEMGSDAIRILMETLLPYINPSLNIANVINEAKAKRKAEL